MTNKRVVITGLGPLSSIGVGKTNVWDGLLKKRIRLVRDEYKIDGKLWDSFLLHKISNFDLNQFGLNKELLNEISIWKDNEEIIDFNYLLAAAKLALDDSGLKFNRERNDVGLVLAHENPGLDQFAEKAFSLSYDILKNKSLSKKDFFEEAYSLSFKSVYDLQTFMFLFHIGKILGTHGCSFFLNNACASGLYALEIASLMIKGGHSSSVIVAAADHPDIFKFLWFKKHQMYALDGLIKPFSQNADGFVFGEGGAGLVVEDLDVAKRRKAEIYAEYLGGSFSSEGWKVSLPAVGKNYYKDTIVRVLNKTKINKQQVDVVIPHGVGIGVADRYEADALGSIFKDNKNRPVYSAFKPYVGHNLGGSALLETVILLLAMKNNILPPLLNCDKKNKKIDLNLLTEKSKKMKINVALKTSSAFAGFDAAILLKRYKR